MVVTIVDKGVFEALGPRGDILVVKGVNIYELANRLNKYISQSFVNLTLQCIIQFYLNKLKEIEYEKGMTQLLISFRDV